MNESHPTSPIRNVSDTAHWAALHRARESERTDALFHDPFARQLAGERGERIVASMSKADDRDWPWAMRTLVVDEFVNREVAAGADMVINLAAGLDARPYRMNLPAALQWIEVDMPELLDEKEHVLAGQKPRCALERVRLDLADVDNRQALLARLGSRASRAMIITEGLLIYLAPDDVVSLARDLAGQPTFQRWVIDLCSPGLLRMMQKKMGAKLGEAGAPFKFAPAEGPLYFEPFGWKPLEVRSLLKTAAKHRRLPWYLRLAALLPDPKGAPGNRRPWGGLCLLGRA